ncbi:MAG: hypothetical protein OIF32_07855 [Campylobacterales bacterium]|nr:hypothetical protein [Campylobacterales bacterium]
MNYEIVKSVPTEEVNELLGFSYFDAVLPVLGWEKKEFIMKLNSYIFTGKADSENLQKFFDMLIELSTLMLVLYKWGILLTNLKASIFSDMVFAVKVDGEYLYFSEANGQFTLMKLKEDETVYKVESYAKSQVFAILLYLYQKESVQVDMLEIDKFQEKLIGNYLSFNKDKAMEQKEYINYIDGDFQKYKTRLEELQKIFLENFTK